MTDRRSLRGWEITGVIATLAIVLTVPIYALKRTATTGRLEQMVQGPDVVFVGRDKCAECHKKEYDTWRNSHHDLAMDEANDKTVLGDFKDAVFEYRGVRSRFFRRDDKFFVNTQGPDGKMNDFEIKYTFGYTPLQQYLIPFPGGRLQCLTIAWDAEKKRWYSLYPDEPNDPNDWLHWTKNGQNWNGMCAECHSTHLQKNYDMTNDTYQTTWWEIDVSCEACHGPGAGHAKWAEVPEMARSQDIENFGLVEKTGNVTARQQVEHCARCHARRATLGDFDHPTKDPLDYMVPQTLNEGLYFPDGQIFGEVYVYGSFVQSKMYLNDVRCSDCHDVHSLKFVKEGNALCLQCHRAEVYDTNTHHFHKKKGEKGDPIRSKDGKVLYEVGEGAECFKCHMPGRYYMGIDYRSDHSLRIPRPDLSVTLKTPNACNECHWDKTAEWSAEYFTKWYGIKRKPHYGTVFEAARQGRPEVQADLIRLADDQLSPAIARATALSLLRHYPDDLTFKTFERALMDPDSLVRHSAVIHMPLRDPETGIRFFVPLLYDPIKAVRIQAAMNLTALPRERLTARQREVFEKALAEYRESMEYVGDFPQGRHNLGNMYSNLGEGALAEQNYTAAIRIDKLFYPAKVNLAMFYNRTGRNNQAEKLLREVVVEYPELYEVSYSLGLLLVEQNKPDEALRFLRKAAEGIPDRARIHYNLGLLLQHLNRPSEAESSLLRALELEPDSFDYLYALADHYIKRGKFTEARRFAEQMISKYPSNDLGRRLLNYMDQMMKRPSG